MQDSSEGPVGMRRAAFSLKSLFGSITVVAILLSSLALWIDRCRCRGNVIVDIRDRHGTVLDYAWDVDAAGRLVPGQSEGGNWCRAFDNNAMNVVEVNLQACDAASFQFERLKVFPSLRRLILDSAGIDDSNMKGIGTLTTLEELSLVNTRVSDNGIHHLSRLSELRVLRLDGTEVADRGLDSVSRLEGLRELSLAHTFVSSQGVQGLSTLTQLHSLDLSNTRVDDRVKEYLLNANSLQDVWVSETDVSLRMIKEVEATRPTLRVFK